MVESIRGAVPVYEVDCIEVSVFFSPLVLVFSPDFQGLFSSIVTQMRRAVNRKIGIVRISTRRNTYNLFSAFREIRRKSDISLGIRALE